MWRLAVAVCVPLALAACGDGSGDVCKAVDANRSAWLAAERLPDAQRREALARVAAEGKMRLAKAVGEGRIEGWKLHVIDVATGLPKLGVVKLALPCAATLIAPEISAQPGAFLPVPTFAPGDAAKIEATFAKSLDGSLPYLEVSVTDKGLMTDPEFVVSLKKIEK